MIAGVVADGRTGDQRGQTDPLGPGRDRAEHGPGERAVCVAVEPWMEVVGDDREVETGRLGRLGLDQEFAGPVELAEQGEAERRHAASF